jgi:hypothetical protein
MAAPQQCPKCNGSMKQGFIVDYANGHWVNKWAPGTPKKSFVRFLWPRQWMPVGTFRCDNCGYLESYADPEYAARYDHRFSLRDLFIAITLIAIVLGIVVIVARS